MKVVYISTYSPRECGISTFTKNLLQAVSANEIGEVFSCEVVALNEGDQQPAYPSEVKFIIDQDQQEDYLKAADFINNSSADCCMLEHEYGIFGGQNGIYILALLHKLKTPIIVTFHTVLEQPSYNEKAVLIEISKMATAIVVMSNKAVGFLQHIYQVPIEKISCIEHGVPEFTKSPLQAKQDLQLLGKNVLLTFGFLGRNKGIETVIKALPKVVEQFPETVYILLGKTHPHVFNHSGEEYRKYLEELTQQLCLTKHVIFINDFISQEGLLTYLSACDIYITPYTNEAQITSGTLSYAIGAGAAVLSTPYWHARELLKESRGRLFGFKDAIALSEILLELLSDPPKLLELRANALSFGKETTWPKIAKKYRVFMKTVVEQHLLNHQKKVSEIDIAEFPSFSLSHIKRLTNQVGIIQHATYALPNYREGYCLDDNARALLLALKVYQEFKDEDALNMIPTYLSYIHYMQREDGRFHNFMTYDHQFLDKVGSEDSFGRTVWAIGYLFGYAPYDGYYQLGTEIFFKAAPHFESLQSIRSIAYTIIGICHYLDHKPNDEGMIERMRILARRLKKEYQENKTANWYWYESLLTYDNAIIPLSLLQASKHLNEEELTAIALQSAFFLEGIILKSGYLSIIGNQQWFHKDKNICKHGQQPIDVLATVLLFKQIYLVTGKKEYLEKMFLSFKWFFGENDLRIALYDDETKGCCDGLEHYGVNRNQGAESTISYLISYLTVYETLNAL